MDDVSQLQTAVGRSLQGDELRKELKKATGTLLALAILQVVGSALLVVALTLPGKSNLKLSAIVPVTVLALGAIYFVLYAWARKNPFPAAIVALVIFATISLIDVLASPATMAGGIVVKAIIILALARAVSAGAKYRRLLRDQQAAAGLPQG